MTPNFFEPSMNVLIFLMAKKFIYLEALLLLASVKVLWRPGICRLLSLITVSICLAGIAAHFIVPYFQIYQQPWAHIAQFLIRTWDGMFTPMLASIVFLNTMIQKQGRMFGVDALHLCLLFGMLILWALTL